MAFRIELGDEGVVVTLTRWDRAMNGRRRVVLPWSAICGVSVVARGDLERLVDSRVLGIGTHDGARRPGRRRIGMMMGRGIAGPQFWAVPAAPPEAPLVVLELDMGDDEYVRAVLGPGDSAELAKAVRTRCGL